MVYGPVPRFLDSLDSLNTSNQRIRAMIQGEVLTTGLPETKVFLFVDVRDVALAHVRALQASEAGGQRYLVTRGLYSNKMIAEIIRDLFPQLADRLPPSAELKDDMPPDVYGFDNGKSRRQLGMTYRALEECVRDTVASMLPLVNGQAKMGD